MSRSGVSSLIRSVAVPLVDQLRRQVANLRLDRIGTLHFDIVRGCQLRCLGCPNSTLQPTIDHIAPEEFDRCLRNIDVRHVDVLRLFNYGEPFLHPDIKGLLDVLPGQAWKAQRIEVSTNAMIFDEKKVREIIGSGLVTHLFVSCDGDGTPTEFERLRPPAKWNRLIAFLEGASRIKRELGAPIQLGTRSVCVGDDGHARWRGVLEPLGWTPEFREWIALPNTSGRPWNRAVRVTSRACWPLTGVHLFVNCRGDVVPCCAYPDLEPLGNLLRQSFSEIHRGPRKQQRIAHLRAHRVDDHICGQCEQ